VRIELRIVGLPATGVAGRVTDAVAQQACPPLELRLEPGGRIEDVIRRAAELGAATGDVQEVLLNGQSVAASTPLRDGDAVTLVGPVNSP